MELIFTGILLAIGFYLAPVVVGGALVIVAGIFAGISNLFGGGR